MYPLLREFVLLFAATALYSKTDAAVEKYPLRCISSSESSNCAPRSRRYDINDLGYDQYFHGWADVQGQGAANDYCRIVGDRPNQYLSCALAGTHGQSEYNFNSMQGFDLGYEKTWYMKDEDGDGRDDYCRCVGDGKNLKISCTKAGKNGFFGSAEQGGSSYTFTVQKLPCSSRKVRPEFGRSLS